MHTWVRTAGKCRRRRGALALGAAGLVAAALPSVAASAASTGYTASLIMAGVSGTRVAVDPATDTMYLASDSGITVINASTEQVVTTIDATDVAGIAVDPSTDTIYASVFDQNHDTYGVDAIDGATDTIAATIDEPSGVYAEGLAVDSTTDTVDVANGPSDEITVIDGASGTITGTVSTGTGAAPYFLAVDDATDTVWVTAADGDVFGVDGATNAVTSETTLAGGDPAGVAVNAASDAVYVADYRNMDVAVLSGVTGAVTTLVPVGEFLEGIDVDQTTGTVFAASPLGTTWVIDGSSDQVEDTIARGSDSVAIDQSTGAVYEAGRDDAVWVLTPSATNAMSPVITSDSAWSFTVGDAGTFTVAASALPAAAFTESGALPSGVTFSSAGVLSGTPAAGSAGGYPLSVTASNGVAPDFNQSFVLDVYQAPTITSAPEATFQTGEAGSFALSATGYPAPSFAADSPLPQGLSISDGAGGWALSGTPAPGTGGVYTFTLAAASAAGTVGQAFTLTVDQAPAIASSGSATFTAGSHGSVQLSAAGYPVPAWSETGSLPAGVTLSPAGLLSGTPAAHSGGVYNITVSASNGIGTAASQVLALTVGQRPSFTSASHVTFSAGHRHSFTFRTIGYPVARLSRSGRLPAGVRFEIRANGTAVLIGTPPRADRGKVYIIKIAARNGVGGAVTQTFRLTIS